MISVFDIITRFSAYAAVIFLGLFLYYKINGKPTKAPYGKYAIISAILMLVSGTIFFSTAEGKAVLNNGGRAVTKKEKLKVPKDTKKAITYELQRTHKMLFKRTTTYQVVNDGLVITIKNSKDTKESLRLVTTDILAAIKNSHYQKYRSFTIKYRDAKTNKLRLQYTFNKNTVTKMDDPAKLRTEDLKGLADQTIKDW